MPNRPAEGPGAGNRPGSPGVADLPANRPGTANRPSQRPSNSDLGNFLGVAGGVAGGAAIADRMADNRPGGGDVGPGNRPAHPAVPTRPEDRPNWNDWSQNRSEHWDQRVDNRNDAWNQRADHREQARNDWQQNQDDRWNHLETAREDRQNWRDQNREDWQQHREDLWDYRGNRAEEIRDHARDFYDNVFDDRWWGACGWGVWGGHYPANPWWWWRRPVGWAPVASFLGAFAGSVISDPVYVDYGVNVVFEDDENVVYVDNQPVPAFEYVEPVENLALAVEQPPPPLPAEAGAPADEWMPLGVFALAQEEKGDPVMFFQISVNRDGVISGAFSNAMTGDERPIAGQVDKKTQRVAWRIGDNASTLFETTLGNLIQDVSPIAVHFGADRTQTWLLVSMPEPAPADKPAAIPPVNAKPPPLKKVAAAPSP